MQFFACLVASGRRRSRVRVHVLVVIVVVVVVVLVVVGVALIVLGLVAVIHDFPRRLDGPLRARLPVRF